MHSEMLSRTLAVKTTTSVWLSDLPYSVFYIIKTLPFILTLLMEVKPPVYYIWFLICSSLSGVHT